jgi:ABC transporter substrate binding protein (PQQ-dependent alcohol dehydrogenase system)
MEGRTSAWAATALVCVAGATWGQEAERVAIGYVHPAERELTLSLLDRPPGDLGLAGAEVGVADNDTTGRFTGQDYALVPRAVPPGDEAAAAEAARALAADGVAAIVADLPRGPLLAAVEAAPGTLVLNVGATDDALRTEGCRATLVHVAPSRAMLADALAQFLVWKRWPRWFLVEGSHEEDAAFADALRRAAGRFGGEVVESRVFEDTGGARTTDSGHVQVQRQLPVFTQRAPSHDVLLVADESEVFGEHMPFHNWDARPVAGTSGLAPTVWSPAHEQWGGIQLQNRFMDDAGRRMQEEDMLAWMAVRMVGEAATRVGGADPATIRDYMLGPDFELAAFKGEALTIRPWNNQLRQPILLADGKTVVSVSPQEGFLHPSSFLDTLGYDEPESACDLR